MGGEGERGEGVGGMRSEDDEMSEGERQSFIQRGTLTYPLGMIPPPEF